MAQEPKPEQFYIPIDKVTPQYCMKISAGAFYVGMFSSFGEM